jgi:putative nucleotidyltransferase with HDIG domain
MLDGQIHRDNDEYLIKKDGTFLPVSMVVTPLYTDNNIVGTVATFKDKIDLEKIVALEEEKLKNQEQIIYSMIEMIESRDSYTAGHTKRVAHYCTLIAKEMGYSDENVELLKNASWLHDIGKISTPDGVLLKPSKLNDTENILVQDHLTSGYEMLSKVDQYKDIAEIMGEHHERFDGKGYPKGLQADEIKPLSRIMIVADAFDAMTTNRVYKAKKTVSVALEELRDLSAKQFHPEVVTAALIALKDIKIDVAISQQPKTSIEEQRFSYFYRDRLTNLFIIDYLNIILRYHISSNSVYMYDIKLHKFSKYNQEFGWKKGDQFLVEFANFIRNLYPDNIIFRVEGDDFLLLSETKIDAVEVNLNTFKLLQESKVEYSVKEEYIDDVYLKFNI